MTQQLKVIIADDEVANLKGIASLLARAWPETEVVARFNNGKAIVEYLQENQADIAILDIRMPLMDGLQVTEYIYENDIDISVIIMTGYKEFEYAKRAIDMHVSAFLEKPFDLGKAVEKIKEVCRERVKDRETVDIARTAGLLLESLMMSKQNEREMLNEIISCYTQVQLRDFIPVFLEKIREIAAMDPDQYLDKTKWAGERKQLLNVVWRIENDFVQQISSAAYSDHNIKQIEKYVEEHCSEDITLRKVAEIFFYNYSYLSRAFKERKGKSFSAYLTQVRMEKAKKLLTENNMNAIEVAGMVGYSEYTNFRKSFASYSGVSPSQYVDLWRMKKDKKK